MPVPKPLLYRMNLSRSLAVMAGNVFTTGLLVLFLSFPTDSGLLWLFPVGALLLGRRYGSHLWRDFFTDRFSALGLGGLSTGSNFGFVLFRSAVVRNFLAHDRRWLARFGVGAS